MHALYSVFIGCAFRFRPVPKYAGPAVDGEKSCIGRMMLTLLWTLDQSPFAALCRLAELLAASLALVVRRFMTRGTATAGDAYRALAMTSPPTFPT